MKRVFSYLEKKRPITSMSPVAAFCRHKRKMEDGNFRNNLFQNEAQTQNVFASPATFPPACPNAAATAAATATLSLNGQCQKSLSYRCKMLCFLRCCYAIGLGVFSQGLLFILLIRLINFHPFHPFYWIYSSVLTILSPFTWIGLLPLLLAAALNGYFLAKFHLALQHYYATRFNYLMKTFFRKYASFVIHLLIGSLTSVSYVQHLNDDYSTIVYSTTDSEKESYLNTKCIFIIGAGIVASIVHFVKENLRKEPTVKFPVIQECILVRLRSLFYVTLYESLRKSLTPFFYYVFGYWLFGSYFGEKCIHFLSSSSELDDQIYSLWSIIRNPLLLIYTWLLMAQIQSGMLLMQEIFSIVLSEEMHFTICHDAATTTTTATTATTTTITNFDGNPCNRNVTLVDALSNLDVPLIQKLAAWDLYTITFSGCFERRKVIYTLSVPGGHPHNWNQLSSQCMAVLEGFLDNLHTTREKTMNKSQEKRHIVDNLGRIMSPIEPHKLFIKQLNESMGVRRLMTPPSTTINNNDGKIHQSPYSGAAFTSTPTQPMCGTRSILQKLSLSPPPPQQQRQQPPPSSSSTTTTTTTNNNNNIFTTQNVSNNLLCKGLKMNKNLPQNLHEQMQSYYEKTMESIKKRFLNLPGIYYLFHKSEEALFLHILSNAEMIIWIMQGLAGICTASLREDNYGVVQSILPKFLTLLLNLDEELDKIEIIHLKNYQKGENSNLYNLRKSVNRVLHKVTSAFGDYLRDFIDDSCKLNKLKRYAKYEM